MKMLLAVLPLSLLSQVPVQEPEKTAAPTPPERTRVTVIDFEDQPIELELSSSTGGCFPHRENGVRRPLVRPREDFDDKVLQSVNEL